MIRITVIFILSFLSLLIYSQKDQFNLTKYYDTLIYTSDRIIESSFSSSQLNNENPYIKRDTTKVKSILLSDNFAIQKPFKKPIELKNSKVDTFFINSLQGDFFYKEFNDFTFFNPIVDIKNENHWEIPESMMYFQNPNSVNVDFSQFSLTSEKLTTLDVNNFFQPFLFQNKEVSNNMYRQFWYYVRDSIGREILAENLNIYDWKIPTYDSLGQVNDFDDWILNWEKRIDWEKYPENEQFEFLSQMYLGGSNRFYDYYEIDVRYLRYEYIDDFGDTITINVCPDTLCWIQDFSNKKLEAMTNMYFWHPAYDDYPVVGLNYYQIEAFCHWYTKIINKKMQGLNLPYKLKFDIPSIIQWDYVRNALRRENKIVLDFPFNWETNLVLTESMSMPVGEGKDTIYDYNDFKEKEGQLNRKVILQSPLSEMATDNSLEFNEQFLIACYYQPEPKKGNHISNVRAMGTGVSEWLQESYEENWKLMYYKRMELLLKTPGADADIQALREEYFNLYNHPKGRMVIGANWYDYRDEYYEGKSFESMDAKVFANPDKGFATVGFRLIATFEPIEK